MSEDEATGPRDTVLLPSGIVLRAQLVVQCATQIAEASDEHPDGLFCGNVLEGSADITFEPGIVAEMAIPCPACSRRLSDAEGRPITALIPLAILVGEEVEDTIAVEPAEGEEAEACPTCGAPMVEEAAGEDAEGGYVELSPEDQGASEIDD